MYLFAWNQVRFSIFRDKSSDIFLILGIFWPLNCIKSTFLGKIVFSLEKNNTNNYALHIAVLAK